MVFVKKPLRVKPESYKKNDSGKPETLTLSPLLEGSYVHLMINVLDLPSLKISGLRLCIGYEGFIIGSCQSSCVGTMFEVNHITDSKPNQDLDNKYVTEWQDKGCMFILDPTGNSALEAIAEIYNDVFFDLSEFNALKEIDKEHKEALLELKTWQLEFNSVTFDDDFPNYPKLQELWGKDILYPALYLTEDDFKPKRGKAIITPEYEGNLPSPITIVKEKIKLPEKGKSSGNKGYGSKPSYMPTLTRLEDALALLTNQKCKELYNAFLDDPSYVSFVISLTGLPLNSSFLPMNQKPQAISNDLLEAFEESKPVTLNDSDITANVAYRLIEALDNTLLNKEFNVSSEKMSTFIFDLVCDLNTIKDNPESEKIVLRNLGFASKLMNFLTESGYPSRETKTALKNGGLTKPIYTWNDEDVLLALEKLNILAF